MFLLGQSFTSNHELIQDVIHDLFEYLLMHKKNLNDICNIKYYLFQSFRNNLIRSIKERLTKLKEFSHNNNQNEIENHSLNIEEFIEKRETNNMKRKLVNQLLSSLSSIQKQIIHLRFYHQMEYSEICSILSLKYQSARTLTYRACCKMREAYVECSSQNNN